MGCLGCCGSEEDCVTNCFGRRRASRSPGASLRRQAPQKSHPSSGVATTTPVVELRNENNPQIDRQVTSPRPEPIRHARAEEGPIPEGSLQNPSRGNNVITTTISTPASRQSPPKVSSNAFADRRAGPSRTNLPRTLALQCDPNDPASPRAALLINSIKLFAAQDNHFQVARIDSPRRQPGRSAFPSNPPAASSWASHSTTLPRRPTVALSALDASSQQRLTGTSEAQLCSIREDNRRRPDASRPLKSESFGSLRSAPRGTYTQIQHPSPALTLRAAATSRISGPSQASTPSHVAGTSRASASSRTAKSSVDPEGEYRYMRLGIESEFFLAALASEHNAAQLGSFVNILASNHNRAVGHEHPRMHHTLTAPYAIHDYSKWTMAEEPSLENSLKPPCKPPLL